MHAIYHDPRSDFMTLYNLWMHYHTYLKLHKTQSQMRKYCRKHFLSYIRMREWQDIVNQLELILSDQKIDLSIKIHQNDRLYEAIHRCIVCGFLSNIATKKQVNIFLASKNKEVMIFPGSSLFNRAPDWIVAAEIVETTRRFARTVGAIKCEWLEFYGKKLCRKKYLSPRWDKKRGEVVADEQVYLFGLLIVPKRQVSYGAIDPSLSTEIFIQSALVEGECHQHFKFLSHNQRLIQKIQAMENKTRRKDLLVSDTDQVDFYRQRLETVYDIRSLKRIIRKKGADDFLKMSESDLLIVSPDQHIISLFPDHVTLNGKSYDLSYNFSPGAPDDGVTLKIPQNRTDQVMSKDFEWLVGGLLREKITTLIKGLPKRYRKQLVPINRTVEHMMTLIPTKDDSPLFSVLSQIIHDQYQLNIPAAIWQQVELPDHLKMRFSLINHKGKTIESNRNLHQLLQTQKVSSARESDARELAAKKWERFNCSDWDFGDLPEKVMIYDHWESYLGLCCENSQINLKLFESAETARWHHQKGVCALLTRKFNRQLKYLQKTWATAFRNHPACVVFGGYDALVKSMIQHLSCNLFNKSITSQTAYEQYIQTVQPILSQHAEKLFNRVKTIVDACEQVRIRIYNIETKFAANPLVKEFCGQIRDDLNHLLPVNFLDIFDTDRLDHLPRYLKAMDIRAERGVGDIQKTLAKNKDVQFFSIQLQEMVQDLTPESSQEKRHALEEFFWMIEEYKVSLFAQELKTAYPISAKRLEKKIGELKWMI